MDNFLTLHPIICRKFYPIAFFLSHFSLFLSQDLKICPFKGSSPPQKKKKNPPYIPHKMNRKTWLQRPYMLLWICLGSVYFAETENFFTESIVDKGKS